MFSLYPALNWEHREQSEAYTDLQPGAGQIQKHQDGLGLNSFGNSSLLGQREKERGTLCPAVQVKWLFCASVCSQGSRSQMGSPTKLCIEDQVPEALKISTLRLSTSLQLEVLKLM